MDSKKTKPNGNNMRFVSFADYVTPPVKEVQTETGNWVEWGADNGFFDYLIELYNNSPTNNACINGTVSIMYGQGLEVVKSDRNLQGYVNLKKTFRANDVRNVCKDYKAFGMAAFEVLFSVDRTKVVRALHLPMNYLRAGQVNDEGEITTWYYSTEWSKSKELGFSPDEYPAFGFQTNGHDRAILVIKPYSFGNYYYSTPDYIGALNWCDVESELSEYHLSNLQNGMWPGMLINFNNGVPDPDDQDEIEKKVIGKWGKTPKTGRAIIAFNRDKDSAATIEPVQLSDAAEQFQAVSNEALEKIMLGHRITSPMLLGIKSNTGLGNNAEELKSAHALFVNTVVKPLQDPILEAIDSILAHNGYALDIYFKPLTPLEFKDYETPIDDETREKETGVTLGIDLALKKEPSVYDVLRQNSPVDLTDEIAEDWLQHLATKGETVNLDEWELAYEEEVVPELENEKLSLFKRFAEPSGKSPEGDSGLYKVRYRYSQNLGANSRTFCKNMVASSKAGIVYRKEDIDQMTAAKLNIELSPADCKRCGYDIWLYKGGAMCGHRWVRQVYFRKRENGKFLPKSTTDNMENDERVSVASAEKAGVPTKKLEPAGWNQANTAPRNTPSKGYKK